MTSNNPINPPMLITTKSSKILPDQCRICGDPAKYSYYGVITCQPCKIFFKRNGTIKQTGLVCRYHNQCEINVNNRHTCPSCRLAKCFKCGMTTDKFRSSRLVKPKINTSVNVQHQLERIPVLNLLQADQSLLTTDQWTLLSNLFHCYKESQTLSFTQRLKDTHHVAQSSYVIYEPLVEEFLVSVYETAGAYLCLNNDLRKLSIDDRAIILRSAADNVCCMGGAFIMKHSYLYDIDAFLDTMNRKYGKRTMDIHIGARKFIDADIVLVKLAISLYAFSENTSCYYSSTSKNLTNPINIFKIQNKYAEVTWKYLLYHYNHADAVKRFLNLTLWLASINILASHAQNLAVHLNDISSIVEQTELTLILDDVDQITEANQ